MASSPRDLAFGPVLPDRECGACTACCTIPEIEELEKPADTTCDHCVEAGCAIYEQRPATCRAFYCVWRRLDSMSDDLRPDKCGVLVMPEMNPESLNPFDRICYVARWMEGDMDAQAELQQRLKALLATRFIPVFFSPVASEHKRLVHPVPEIYHAIVDGARATGKNKDKAKRWRALLPRTAR